jgi:hypothetical protein
MQIKSMGGGTIAISGRVFRYARIRDEPYVCLDRPDGLLDEIRRADLGIDVFSFVRGIADQTPKLALHFEWDSLAVLPISTFDNWWKKQINDKTRNMVRKAQKGGIALRLCEFNDDFVKGIMEIYNECPIRQGKPFQHYGKDFETIRRDHATFAERSEFIGAFHGEALIGFAKLVHSPDASSLMQIISMVSFRDKAPTNALLAKAVEICAKENIPFLHYGVWSRRGLGDFKKHHAFVRFDIPRYFVPLNFKGHVALKLKLHRRLADRIPPKVLDDLIQLRNRWNSFRLGNIAR